MLIYLQMIEAEDDRTKFEHLYLKYKGLMFYVTRRILQNEQDAEDAVQQALISIAKNIKKVSDVQCPETRSYVVIIAERKAIDILRNRSRSMDVELNENITVMEIPLPGDHGLADAIAQLPVRYREVLLLRFDSGFSTSEIAKMLDMSQGSVQKLIWRAKEALQKILEEDKT